MSAQRPQSKGDSTGTGTVLGSIVLPAFNEAGVLEDNFAVLDAYLRTPQRRLPGRADDELGTRAAGELGGTVEQLLVPGRQAGIEALGAGRRAQRLTIMVAGTTPEDERDFGVEGGW
jgi:hypothetical protein